MKGKEKVSHTEGVNGLRQQAQQELRMMDKNKDRQELCLT